MKKRIALVVSHPIQHFCPQYVSFAMNTDIAFEVFFASALGLKKYVDPNFKHEISWGNLHLDKFAHRFLNGVEAIPSDKNIDAILLDEALDEFKPDVVIVYGYYQKLQRRAFRWANRNNVKIAYISDGEHYQHRNKMKQILKYFYIKWLFSRIDYFFSVGNANEEMYRYYGVQSDSILRMHFPIDINQYQSAYDEKNILRQNIRESYSLKENDILLTTVGKLVSWKNQGHLIDAVRMLEEEGTHLNLIILGSGDLMDELKKNASTLKVSKVFFPGFVSIEELPSYYAATDIYAHVASIEPHSLAISEAIYMGCPVVISDRCGSYGESDDVQDGLNGFVFEFGKIRQLADQIKSLVLDKEKRDLFSKYSHNLAVEFQQRAHYSILSQLLIKLQKE